MSPTVSIVMAAYNGESHIKMTVDSILNQTFSDFEFIIVDDSSSDLTVELLESYCDSRIRLYRNENNIGQTRSLNIGLSHARGRFIARTDVGDISLPLRLEHQVLYMNQNPQIKVLGTAAFEYDTRGKIRGIVHMPLDNHLIVLRSIFTTPVVHVSVLMERETILSLGGYDERYYISADYDLWSRLLRNNYLIGNLDKILVGYMVSSGSLSNRNISRRSINEVPAIIQKNLSHFTKTEISIEKAANIYRMFTFKINYISLKEIIKTERMVFLLLEKYGATKKEINYYLLKNWLQYILWSIKQGQPEDGKLIICLIRSFVQNTGCLLSFKAISTILTKYGETIFWRLTRKNIISSLSQ